jgi:broad specificity phosphatase PhoE
MRHLLAVVLLVLCGAVPALAQPTVVLVRHAERADAGRVQGMMASDPELSGAGKLRAGSLAKLLRDTGIRTIFTTEYKRTQQTAAPLATALAVRPTIVPSKDVVSLAQQIKSSPVNVLVVGHSNTIPDILKALGVSDPVTIGDEEYDNVFIVVRGTLVRLRY